MKQQTLFGATSLSETNITMPAWTQPCARWQPLSPSVLSIRSFCTNDGVQASGPEISRRAVRLPVVEDKAISQQLCKQPLRSFTT